MSVASIGIRISSPYWRRRAVRNTERVASDVNEVQLSAGKLWRLKGDNQWRVISCSHGAVWVTQKYDTRDYVLETGDVFIITQPGLVIVQALQDASVQITSSLKTMPFMGSLPSLQ